MRSSSRADRPGEPSHRGERDEPDDRLLALVSECIDRMQDEGESAIEAVCRSHPADAAAILERLALLRQSGFLAAETGGGPRIPECVGDYRLLRRIGGGGMGLVYLAEQTSLGRRAAKPRCRSPAVPDQDVAAPDDVLETGRRRHAVTLARSAGGAARLGCPPT